jgi:hypothetical protein
VADGQANAKLRQGSMDLIAGLDPIMHVWFAHTVQRRQINQSDVFDQAKFESKEESAKQWHEILIKLIA